MPGPLVGLLSEVEQRAGAGISLQTATRNSAGAWRSKRNGDHCILLAHELYPGVIRGDGLIRIEVVHGEVLGVDLDLLLCGIHQEPRGYDGIVHLLHGTRERGLLRIPGNEEPLPVPRDQVGSMMKREAMLGLVGDHGKAVRRVGQDHRARPLRPRRLPRAVYRSMQRLHQLLVVMIGMVVGEDEGGGGRNAVQLVSTIGHVAIGNRHIRKVNEDILGAIGLARLRLSLQERTVHDQQLHRPDRA